MLSAVAPVESGAGAADTAADMAADDTGVLKRDVIDRCFAGLESAGPIVLAVSGGPDSLALMLMASRWAAHLGPTAPRLHVATVDHGLRPEARLEAEAVAMAANRLGLPHRTLTWTGDKPKSRIQERARQARYALLADLAASIGATHLFTAHHADDQAETVLMRLGRGSGIGGLAGMRRETPLTPWLTLVRPLLDLPKSALVAACRTADLTFADDPSNRDPAYARARLRAEAPTLARLGLDRDGLGRLARRMARADAALEDEACRWENMLRREAGPGVRRLDLGPALDVSPEIRIRLVRRAISALRPEAMLRLDRLETLTEDLWTALAATCDHRATLGGTRVILERDRSLEIRAEARRSRGRARHAPATAGDAPRLRPN